MSQTRREFLGRTSALTAGAMAAATPELKVVKIEQVTDFQQELIKNIGKILQQKGYTLQ